MATVTASFGSAVETACVMPINAAHASCAAADVTATRAAGFEPDIRPSRLVAHRFIAREQADCHCTVCADAVWVGSGRQNHDPGTRGGGFVGMACGAIAASRRAGWTQPVSDCDDCAAVGPRRCVAGGYTAHNLEARGDRHYRGVCQLYCFWLHYCGDLATLQRFHGAVIPSWGGNWPMGRTVKFYLPQNRAVFVHRPMGFSPPHGQVTAP